MNLKLGIFGWLSLAGMVLAQDSTTVVPMVAPTPIPSPPVVVDSVAVVPPPAQPVVPVMVQKPVVVAPVVPQTPAPVASTPKVSTGFKAEKVPAGKWTATAKSDKNRPAKAVNRERWRSNRIQRAERNAEIGRNEGRRLRIQAQRLNKLEVKKEEGAALSPESLALLENMLASDLELQYYAGQDKQWKNVSRELKRLDQNGTLAPENKRKEKYRQAEERVPVLP